MIKQVPIICDDCNAQEMTFESTIEDDFKTTIFSCPCGFEMKELYGREKIWGNVTLDGKCEPVMIGVIWAPIKKSLTKQ